MSAKARLRKVIPTSAWLRLRALRNRCFGVFWYRRGFRFAKNWLHDNEIDPLYPENEAFGQDNPLWQYFQNHQQGHGIWKWEHYFPVYHRHMKKYVGRNPSIVEIGVFSGGSLDMWADYFGECQIFGIDIEDACKSYERENVHVFIGDQADPNFWGKFKSKVPKIDVLIDDGGHTPDQQSVTLKCMLPHLRSGGVYICEDVEGIHNRFAAFATGIVGELNRMSEEGSGSDEPSEFQRSSFSIHFYPFMVIIEKSETPLTRLLAPKHGSEWQPFLDKKLSKPAADTRL